MLISFETGKARLSAAVVEGDQEDQPSPNQGCNLIHAVQELPALRMEPLPKAWPSCLLLAILLVEKSTKSWPFLQDGQDGHHLCAWTTLSHAPDRPARSVARQAI